MVGLESKLLISAHHPPPLLETGGRVQGARSKCVGDLKVTLGFWVLKKTQEVSKLSTVCLLNVCSSVCVQEVCFNSYSFELVLAKKKKYSFGLV